MLDASMHGARGINIAGQWVRIKNKGLAIFRL